MCYRSFFTGGTRIEREIQVAERLAREAGAVALRYREGDLRVERKLGNEPVTDADHACSELVVAGLREAFPDDVVISEEAPDDARRRTARRVWYIDPIDGTKDYIHGRDGFSVMIGLCVDREPVLGLVYQPMGDRLFAAAPDRGTVFYAPGAAPRVLHCSTTTDPARLRLVASRSSRRPVIDEVKSALGIADEANIGSVGLKLALIVLDERDLYVNPDTYCKYWDTCAPEAILRYAGGKFTDIHGRPLRYDRETTSHDDGLVASNGAAHDAVIAKLAPLFPRR